MKATVLLVFGLAALATASVIDDVVVNVNNVKNVVDVRQKQVVILKLLNQVMEPCVYKDVVDVGVNFKVEDNVNLFTRVDVVKRLVNVLRVGILPRGEVFTVNIDRQLEEVVTMFHVLYYAKDFETFVKVACWMRVYVNEGMFVYALSVAVRHREDCRGVVLPPPYEIYPYYFVRADVIQKAYMVKMKKGVVDVTLADFYGIRVTDKGVVVIDENIYDTRVYVNDEDRLRYFTEDIDLNTYYYYFHVDYPFWMKDVVVDKLKVRRGELALYINQQIVARYYLERLSNGLGEVVPVSWNRVIKNGYVPWMVLHNGVQVRSRMNNYVVVRDDVVDVVNVVEVYENIIKEAIVKGFVEVNGVRLELTKPEDVEVLGQLVYGVVDKSVVVGVDVNKVQAYRYLVVLINAVVGLNVVDSDKYFVVPSVLDQYQTCLRDPVFYQIQKRLVDLVIMFKRRLPSYTKEDVLFPGVKVDNVVVDKLVTYFDDSVVDISNVVTLTDEEIKKGKSDVVVMVRKRRLNHVPFKVTIDVVSDKVVDSVVRVFIGPKVDVMGRVIDINKNRVNFVEIDSFVYKLDVGKNVIVRNSRDMHNVVGDRMMVRDLWRKVVGVNDVSDVVVKNLKNYVTGFPDRLIIPKGKVGGMEMVVYVVVTPLRLVDNVDVNVVVVNNKNVVVDVNNKNVVVDYRSTVLLDKMPLGFPLDRHIDVTKFFVPNMKFVDVVVYHKKVVCDMKVRWNRWVLGHYNMVNVSPIVVGGNVVVDGNVVGGVVDGVVRNVVDGVVVDDVVVDV